MIQTILHSIYEDLRIVEPQTLGEGRKTLIATKFRSPIIVETILHKYITAAHE